MIVPTESEAEQATREGVRAVEKSMEATHEAPRLSDQQRETLMNLAKAAVHDPKVQQAFLQNQTVMTLMSMFANSPPASRGNDTSADTSAARASSPSSSEEGDQGQKEGGVPIASASVSIPQLLKEGATALKAKLGQDVSSIYDVFYQMLQSAKEAAITAFGLSEQSASSSQNQTANSTNWPLGDMSESLGQENAAFAGVGLGVACVALSIVLGRRLGVRLSNDD